MNNRLKTGLGLVIFIAPIMFIGGVFFALISTKSISAVFFTEDYLFYEILLVLIGLFCLGFAFGKGNKNQTNGETDG